MKSAQEFLNDVNAIVSEMNKNENNVTKEQLVSYQKRIRLIKRDVVSTRNIISAQYENKKANSSPGCLSSLFGKGYARSENARNKRSIHNQKLIASNQYSQVVNIIEKYMTEIDEMKAKRYPQGK